MSLFLKPFSLLNRVKVKKWELRKAGSFLTPLLAVLHLIIRYALQGMIFLQLVRYP
jgi:hypothetical protein